MGQGITWPHPLFADDLTACAKWLDAAKAAPCAPPMYPLLSKWAGLIWGAAGLEPAPRKGLILSSNPSAEGSSPPAPFSSSGVLALGLPIGPDQFCEAHVGAVPQSHRGALADLRPP